MMLGNNSGEIKKKGSVRQHFVPQFYLRNFGTDIHCFDKKGERKFKSTPENIAVKADFYGGEYEGLPSLEGAFAQIENRHAEAMKNLISIQDYYKLSHEDKLGICEFLGLQYLRTEKPRESMLQTMESVYNTTFASIIPKELKITFDEKNMIGFHLESLKDYRRYAVLFFNMRFMVTLNRTSVPYWTSDNPIVKQNEYDQHPFGNLGITNRGIEFHLPLTPRLFLHVLDPTIFNSAPNFSVIHNKQHAIRENFLQLNHSTRFVYSDTSRFLLIKDMLRDNPHFKDNKRTTMDVLTGVGKNAKYLINTERNDRWPIKGELMGKLETWIDPEFVEKIFKDKKYDG